MRFLVFQHLDIEHPGVFRDHWRAQGIAWDTVELDRGDPIPPLELYDALVVMGGPQDVWQVDAYPWLVPEIAAIRHFVRDLGRPYLGMCLGHQLLAVALGGEVGPADAPEVGLYHVDLTEQGQADPALEGLPAKLPVFQWHGAEVTSLPSGATILARSDLCAVQAFRWGRHAYGFQFHAEITNDTVGEWGAVPEYAAALEDVLGPGALDTLGADVIAALPGFGVTAQKLSTNLIRAFAGHIVKEA